MKLENLSRLTPVIDLAPLKRTHLSVLAPPALAWALGAAVALIFTVQVDGWYVMSDELQHAKLGLSIANDLSLTPRLHGRDVEIYSQLYPLLTAPFYGLMSMPSAFKAIHVFNALAMASAAVPVYMLARDLRIPRLGATAVATVAVLTPWMVITLMVMTEVVAYPAFAWALLAIHRAVVKPSPGRDLLALSAIALAFLARTQLLVLGGVYAAVVVGHVFVYPLVSADAGRRRSALRQTLGDALRGHPFLIAAAACAAALPLVGYSYEEVLGSYGSAATGDLLPPGVLDVAIENLDVVTVGVAVIPLIAAIGWAITGVAQPTTKSRHAFALLVLVSIPILALQASSFVLRFGTGGVYDRYLFYLAPILFLGLAVFLCEEVRPISFVAMAIAGGGFFLIANDTTYDTQDALFFSTPAGVFHSVLGGRTEWLGELLGIEDLSPTVLIELVVLATAVGLPLALRYLPRTRVAVVVGVGVLAFSVVECVYVFNSVGDGVEGTDWADRAVGEDADVGLVPFEVGGYPPPLWWSAEFWNKDVTRSYSYADGPAYTPFPNEDLMLNRRTGEIKSSVLSLAPYLVMHEQDRRFRPLGHTVSRHPVAEGDLELIDVEQPPTAAWTGKGFEYHGAFPSGAKIRFYGGSQPEPVRRRITFRLAASRQVDPALPRGPQQRRRFELRGPGIRRQGVLKRGEQQAETVEICIPGSATRTFRITGTGNGYYGAAPGIKGLPIGVKVSSIDVRTESRACG